uniref:Uncharacterized protein n=1 Tax=Ditylenchus dipsaci TaxID=166011 RepID=A0A915CQP4_9BILA
MSEGEQPKHSPLSRASDRLSWCENVALRSLRETSPLELQLADSSVAQHHKHIAFSVSDPCCRASSNSSIQALRGYTPPPTSPLVVAASSWLPCSNQKCCNTHSPPICSSSSPQRPSHGQYSPGSSHISTTKVPFSSICARRKVPTPLSFCGLADHHQQSSGQASPSGSVFSPCYLHRSSRMCLSQYLVSNKTV